MKQWITAFAVLLLSIGSARAGDGWTSYQAKDYGFSMMVPEGTQMIEKTWPAGWAGVRGESEGVVVVGIAKLGPAETAAEIERFGAEVTGTPAANWTEIDKGNGHGWNWYRTVTARKGDELYFGGYGVGAKGSFLILLRTTAQDFADHRADYDAWYESIRLD